VFDLSFGYSPTAPTTASTMISGHDGRGSKSGAGILDNLHPEQTAKSLCAQDTHFHANASCRPALAHGANDSGHGDLIK